MSSQAHRRSQDALVSRDSEQHRIKWQLCSKVLFSVSTVYPEFSLGSAF
jgi:hypothetical protein